MNGGGACVMSSRRQGVRLEDLPEEDQYVFTSLRYDCKAKKNKLNPFVCKEAKTSYLLKYHFDRLRDAAGGQGWYDAQKSMKKASEFYERINYAVCNHKKETGNKGPFKVSLGQFQRLTPY